MYTQFLPEEESGIKWGKLSPLSVKVSCMVSKSKIVIMKRSSLDGLCICLYFADICLYDTSNR